MIAITTKFHGATNTRGSRITATMGQSRATVPYDHALTAEGNHAAAAKAIAQRRLVKGEWISAPVAGGWVFVMDTTGDRWAF
jgi:hypothetical protein